MADSDFLSKRKAEIAASTRLRTIRKMTPAQHLSYAMNKFNVKNMKEVFAGAILPRAEKDWVKKPNKSKPLSENEYDQNLSYAIRESAEVSGGQVKLVRILVMANINRRMKDDKRLTAKAGFNKYVQVRDLEAAITVIKKFKEDFGQDLRDTSVQLKSGPLTKDIEWIGRLQKYTAKYVK